MARVNLTPKLQIIWRSVVKSQVESALKNATPVESLIALREDCEAYIEKAFKKDNGFFTAQKAAYEAIFDAKSSESATLLANYADNLAVKGTDETKLQKFMQIFKYLSSKDYFEAIYLKKMSHRLLRGITYNLDNEKIIVGKMKEECGTQFMSKAESMFTDLEVTPKIDQNSEFNVTVVSQGVWTPACITLSIPHEIEPYMKRIKDAQTQFDHFYKEKNLGKSVTWDYALSYVQLFCPQLDNIFLDVSGVQACVLLWFNDHKVATIDEIVAKYNLTKPVLKKELDILEAIHIVNINADKKELSLNTKFTSSKKKINVLEFAEDSEEPSIREQVLGERKTIIEACITKILKFRKKCTHTDLLALLHPQLQFNAEITDIKQCIENLITLEYIKRDEENNAEYIYIT